MEFEYVLPLDIDIEEVPYSFEDFLDGELFANGGPIVGTAFEATLMERADPMSDNYRKEWRLLVKAAAEYSIDMPYKNRKTGEIVTVRSELARERTPNSVW